MVALTNLAPWEYHWPNAGECDVSHGRWYGESTYIVVSSHFKSSHYIDCRKGVGETASVKYNEAFWRSLTQLKGNNYDTQLPFVTSHTAILHLFAFGFVFKLGNPNKQSRIGPCLPCLARHVQFQHCSQAFQCFSRSCVASSLLAQCCQELLTFSAFQDVSQSLF